MRRFFLFTLVAIGTVVLSGCLTIEERISLNQDGSGVHTNTVDVSTLLDNPLVKMGLAEKMQEQGAGEVPSQIDSSFTILEDLLPYNQQWTAAERELIGRVNGKITMDLEEGLGIVTTEFPFTTLEEVGQMSALLSSANKPEGAKENPFAGMSGVDFLVSTFTMKGKKMSRTTKKAPNFENPLAEQGLDESMMGMMQEMFGDAVLGYRIDFPGTIKKVKGFPNHEIDGNSIYMLFDFMEVMEDPELMAKALTGEVKFR